jgi:hypothetical protein
VQLYNIREKASYRKLQIHVESELTAAIDGHCHVMFIPKYWSCKVEPDGDEAIVADVKTNLSGYFFDTHISIEWQTDKFSLTVEYITPL